MEQLSFAVNLLKTELTAVTSFDGERVIAVGLNGIVLTSSNAGKVTIVKILFRLLSPEPQAVYVLLNECL
jgi:ABC-type multidrug transport system fused ATPase/permease subunit